MHGFETFTCTLHEAEFPSESADVMVMLHVIEHVPSPTDILAEIFRILRPGGHLVMETPRYDTLMYKLFGRRERSLRQNGHIYFYSIDSLRKTYEKVGFEEVETRSTGRSMTFDRMLWNAGNATRSETLKGWIDKGSKALRLNRRTMRLNLGDIQRVIVRKPG